MSAPPQPLARQPWREGAEAAGFWLLTLGALATFVLAVRHLAWPMVDDAGIALAYGRTLFEGGGLRLTPHSQQVEGFSSPLFMVLQGLGWRLGVDPVRWSQWLGAGCGALALVVVAGLPGALQGRRCQVQDGLGPLLAAATPIYPAWCSSGMETGLWALTVSVVLWVLARGAAVGAPLLVGVVTALAWLVRPEAPLLALAVVPGWLLLARRAGRPALRGLLVLVLGAAAVGLALLAARWALFADLVPNTYHVKKAWNFDGAAYLRAFVAAHPRLVWLAAVGMALGLLVGGTRAVALVLGGAAAALLLFAGRSGDWMPEHRFLAPAVPFLAALAPVLASAARPRRPDAPRVRAVVALVLALDVAMLLGQEGWRRLEQVQRSRPFDFAFVVRQAEGFRPRLAAQGQRRPLLAFADMGGSAWALREAEWIDAAGLCDRAISMHSPHADQLALFDDYLAHEGPPTFLDIHGPSGSLGQPKVKAQLESAGSFFHQPRGLTAAQDPRCPDGKAAALALTADALHAALGQDLAAGDALRALRRWRCAFAYQPDDQLPSRAQREALGAEAFARARALEAEGQLEPALRHASFATVVAGHPAAWRRHTELLRRRVVAAARPAPPAP